MCFYALYVLYALCALYALYALYALCVLYVLCRHEYYIIAIAHVVARSPGARAVGGQSQKKRTWSGDGLGGKNEEITGSAFSEAGVRSYL